MESAGCQHHPLGHEFSYKVEQWTSLPCWRKSVIKNGKFVVVYNVISL